MNKAFRKIRFAVPVLFALGLVCSGATAAVRSTPVTVVNSESQPVPVQPAGMTGIPVQTREIMVIPAGDSNDTIDLFDVPAGSLLIVDYLTVTVDSRAEEQGYLLLLSTLDGTEVGHNLGPMPPSVYTGLGSGQTQFLQRSLSIYSDSLVRFSFSRGTGLDGERAILQISISGRLVPDPNP